MISTATKWIEKGSIERANQGLWQETNDTVDPNTIIELMISIKYQKALMEELLSEISNPTSKNYGKHLSKEKVKEMATLEEDRTAVGSYVNKLVQRGAKIKSERDGMHVVIEGSVGLFNEVLHTEFKYYSHPDKAKILRCNTYSLDSHIANSVECIHNTVQFPVSLTRGGPHLNRDAIRVNPRLQAEALAVTSKHEVEDGKLKEEKS